MTPAPGRCSSAHGGAPSCRLRCASFRRLQASSRTSRRRTSRSTAVDGVSRGAHARARDRLVVHYRPLVRIVAHRDGGLPTHVDPADLVQSGVFGLLEAIDRFDPERCARFESYAVPRIRGAVLDELRAQDWVPRTVRLPRPRGGARSASNLSVRLRRTATDREIADALQLPLRELQRRSGRCRC